MSEKKNAEIMELLPCPFCGRSAHITEDDSRFFIGCDDCFCAVGEAYDGCAMPAHCFYEEEAAIDAWNNRAAASPHAGGAVMLELAEYLKEQAERLRRILKREVVPGRPQFDSCLHAFTSAENTVRQILLRAAAPSPHPRGEPVAWQFRQRSGIGNGPQRQAPWCDWCSIDREDYDRYSRKPNDLIEVRPLFAAPPPAGADAVGAATDQLCVVEADLNCLHAIVKQACDLLSEKTNGSAARSPAHNARLLLERAIASIPAPKPQEKPTGDQT